MLKRIFNGHCYPFFRFYCFFMFGGGLKVANGHSMVNWVAWVGLEPAGVLLTFESSNQLFKNDRMHDNMHHNWVNLC